ncbi:peptidoglycan-binding protein [Actinomadura sp. NBRC 104412]|uniref:peptidoglycan-binding domain-containing protein n=1 Tax=Actinomadura sp. NBRC 104412 TaxID=3032203 RepID=UPI00249F99A6|nr:peptidoglycan-binding domain-containing protein [Actinomadura sp. NBRC 104412]GLZ07487.1 peptidoglycan-binding protein [Actinomadura sp. NBRC 104412]
MNRLYVAIGVLVLTLAIVASITAVTVRDDGGQNTSEAAFTRTARVTRGDLVDTETVDGTLGYGDEKSLINGASGKVTWTREDGSTVSRGQTLYAVNDDPVTLMYGSVPMYRALSVGVSEGRDVEQLEANLKALGHGDDLTVDDDFTTATADAVKAWQDDRGLPVTGRVDPKQIIFFPEAVRITSTKIFTGAAARPGSVILTVTGTKRQVSVNLDTSEQQFARQGAKVNVQLPDGTTVPGKIAKVGTVATVQKQSGTPDGQPPESTIAVDITLDDPRKAGALDRAPVSVEMESTRHENVLSVPVEALIALRDGGYGLQLVQGTTVRLTPVKTGLFAQGRVEISGAGVAEGTIVGVPSK